MFRSIRSKILAVAGGVILIAVSASGLLSGYFFSARYSEALQSNAVAIGRTLQLQLERLLDLGIPLNELVGFDEQCEELRRKHEEVGYVLVLDREGRILFHSTAPDEILSGSEGVPDNLPSDRPTVLITQTTGTDYYDVTIPVLDVIDELVGFIRLGIPHELIEKQTRSLVRYSLFVGAISLALSMALLMIIMGRVLIRPLSSLAEAIRGFTAERAQVVQPITANSQDEIGHIARAINRMLEALRSAQLKLERLAHYDSLTNLPNRTFFLDEMERRLAHARRHGTQIAFLFLDLDRFKAINDTFGHRCGDTLLVEVASRLQRNLRTEDFPARLSGDEFLVAIEEAPHFDAVAIVARNIIELLAEPFQVEGNELVVTGSVGISVFPSDGDELSELLKHADTAMYRAKTAGGNNYRFYAAEMSEHDSRSLLLESRLRQAVESKELRLNFQPQISLEDNCVTGFEALLRWEPEDIGPVSPDTFVPIAVECRCMVQIDDWVLREACREATRWQRENEHPVRVSVNISLLHLKQANFAERVLSVLEEAGLAPSLLELEITESFFSVDTEAGVTEFRRLRSHGVRIAIDDFGTGYSSLSRLQHYPIDCLKIDRSFVVRLEKGGRTRAIVASIIALGRNLGMNVIAEGVENEAQLESLRALGANAVQGFLISPPLTKRAALMMLQDQRGDMWPQSGTPG